MTKIEFEENPVVSNKMYGNDGFLVANSLKVVEFEDGISIELKAINVDFLSNTKVDEFPNCDSDILFALSKEDCRKLAAFLEIIGRNT